MNSWTRTELKFRGNMQIKRQYLSYVLASFLLLLFGGFGINLDMESFSGQSAIASAFFLMSTIFEAIGSLAVTFFIGGPIEIGVRRFYLTGVNGMASLSVIGTGFCKETYWKNAGAVFLPKLYCFLWSFLFVIPGIIKQYQYYFVPWIVAEQPEVGVREAMNISSGMTRGHKWNMFVLELSFLGWMLVGAMCCGVGVVFVMPYKDAVMTQLYETLKVIEVRKETSQE